MKKQYYWFWKWKKILKNVNFKLFYWYLESIKKIKNKKH